MSRIDIKFAAYSKAMAPQPIRAKIGTWPGEAQKMVNGSQPQPWHCMPFMEASTYGLELVYPYDNPCTVVNDGGLVRFDWDFAGEKDAELSGGEFMLFAPEKQAKYYLFNTRVDIVPPPGYVIRTEPHPRYFTDETQTAPLALIGHVQNEWWPRKLFVVFRAPLPGQCQVFRKNEPYAQVIFLPQRITYGIEKMAPEEEARRRKMESEIGIAKHDLAENIWENPDGSRFNNHYKVLARAFNQQGEAGVERTVAEAMQRHSLALGLDKPVPEALALAQAHLQAERYTEARALYSRVLEQEPGNSDAMSHLGICLGCMGQPGPGVQLLARAVESDPQSAALRNNLAEMLRMLGRLPEAEIEFRASLQLQPRDMGIASLLGLTMAQQGRVDEGLAVAKKALELGQGAPILHYRVGMVLVQAKRYAEARAAMQSALAADANFSPARRALAEMPSA